MISFSSEILLPFGYDRELCQSSLKHIKTNGIVQPLPNFNNDIFALKITHYNDFEEIVQKIVI